MRNSMISQYGKEKGERVFWSTINKKGLNETKPMKGQTDKKEEYGPGTLIEKPYQPKKEDFQKKLEEEMKAISDIMKTKSESKKLEDFKTKGITMGNDKFKPWYMNNRPMGPPRSPDQEKTAQSFKNATDEILAAWNEMESGERAKSKEKQIDAFLAESKKDSAFLKKEIGRAHV